MPFCGRCRRHVKCDDECPKPFEPHLCERCAAKMDEQEYGSVNPHPRFKPKPCCSSRQTGPDGKWGPVGPCRGPPGCRCDCHREKYVLRDGKGRETDLENIGRLFG